MAEKNSSRIRYDDIVNAVHADPAQAEPMILLSGLIGRGAEDGSLRVYPEASLGRWLEVAEADVVHSAPLADSPLGGSNVWVRSSARVTPGVATPPAPPEGEKPAGGEAAGVPLQGADTGVFNPLAAPWTGHFGCPTVEFWCPRPGPVPPPWTGHFGCPTMAQWCPPQGAPRWTHTGCATREFPCTPTNNPNCAVTIACLGGGLAQAAAMPSVPGCLPPTHNIGCPDTISCAPQHISLPGCIHTGTCPPQAAAVGTIGLCPTIGFTCTLIDCPGGGYGAEARMTIPCLPPTYNPGCPSTVSCPPAPTHAGCGLAAEARFTIPCLPPTYNPGCPSTVSCPPAPTHAGCGYGAEAMGYPTGSPTASTRCFICPPDQFGAAAAAQNTAATVCTQIGCVSVAGHCPTVGAQCAGGQQMVSMATICPTVSPAACPTLGIACVPTLAGPCLPFTLSGCQG